jgi:hypothetical protein
VRRRSRLCLTLLVQSIEPLTSLSQEQLRLLDQLEWPVNEKEALRTRLSPEQLDAADGVGEWPWSVAKEALRAYWFDDGSVLVAPFDPRIRPGMDVVAERRTGVVDSCTVPDGSSATLHWAAALRVDR